MGYGILLLGYITTVTAYAGWMSAIPIVGAVLCCIGLWKTGRFEKYFRYAFPLAAVLGLLAVFDFTLNMKWAGRIFPNADTLTQIYEIVHLIVYLIFNFFILMGIMRQAIICKLPSIGKHARFALMLLLADFLMEMAGLIIPSVVSKLYSQINFIIGIAFYLLTLAAIFRCFNRMQLGEDPPPPPAKPPKQKKNESKQK